MGYEPELREWDQITKIKGEYGRHIEQLWDEIKKLREEMQALKWFCSHLEDELDEKADK